MRLGAGPEQRLAGCPPVPASAPQSGRDLQRRRLAPGLPDPSLGRGAATEPWVLFSDRPAGPGGCASTARARAEATYADEKGRGFRLDRSKLAALERIERLLLAVHLALWWTYGLGLQAVRNGQRPRYDRRDRRRT